MEFSHRLDLFGPEIFAALNDKKVALEAEGRHLFNLSVGTPDSPTVWRSVWRSSTRPVLSARPVRASAPAARARSALP